MTPSSVIFQKEFQNTLNTYKKETNTTELINVRHRIKVTEENNLDNKEYMFDLEPMSKRVS